MVDFMTNIKNKKNMTKCNIKTLMATSVLCVFFNGILIYGMEGGPTVLNNINFNNNQEKLKNFNIDPSVQVSDKNFDINPFFQEPDQNFNFNGNEEGKLNENKNESFNINPKYTIKKKKTKGDILKNVQNIQNIQKNILRNYKGHLSLCLCCNLFNNKEENMCKFFAKQENPELMLNIKNMSGDNKYIHLMPVGCDKDINGPDNGSNGKMFEMKEINSELKDSKKEE